MLDIDIHYIYIYSITFSKHTITHGTIVNGQPLMALMADGNTTTLV